MAVLRGGLVDQESISLTPHPLEYAAIAVNYTLHEAVRIRFSLSNGCMLYDIIH